MCRTIVGSCSFLMDPLNSNENSKYNQVNWSNLSFTPVLRLVSRYRIGLVGIGYWQWAMVRWECTEVCGRSRHHHMCVHSLSMEPPSFPPAIYLVKDVTHELKYILLPQNRYMRSIQSARYEPFNLHFSFQMCILATSGCQFKEPQEKPMLQYKSG